MLDDSAHPLEVTCQQCTQPLRIERLAESGRARHVAKENRHRLALLPRPTEHNGQREAALLAELGASAVLVPATRANHHGTRLDRIPSHNNWPSGVTPTIKLAQAATPVAHRVALMIDRDREAGSTIRLPIARTTSDQ